MRRVDQHEDAADVVAETFLVAWRRNRDLPPHDETRLWLYGVARRVLANHHRGGIRRERLGERLRQRLTPAPPADPGAEVADRLAVQTALARLGELDRAVLTLTVWEELQPREVATVLGVSPDRLQVSDPQAVEVAGAKADLFVYSTSDFAAMLPPRGKTFVELRTGGAWSRAAFDAILAEIVRADVPTWLAALPENIVTPDRVATEAKRVLADVPLPPKFSVTSLADLGTNDAYQFGAGVTGRVGCGWIAEWLRAKKAGDAAALGKAAAALRSSREWKVLKDMEDQGGWSQVFWETAEEVAAGKPSPGYAGAIGCDQ